MVAPSGTSGVAPELLPLERPVVNSVLRTHDGVVNATAFPKSPVHSPASSGRWMEGPAVAKKIDFSGRQILYEYD
eukprot:1422997-Prymnesium_polylepis.1